MVLTETPFTLAIASSHVVPGNIAQTLHVGRELLAFVKNKRFPHAITVHVIREIANCRLYWLRLPHVSGPPIHNDRCEMPKLSAMVADLPDR